MATRSQQFRAQTQRDAAHAHTAAKASAAHAAGDGGHIEKKATYAAEEGVALDERSRKSTRKSANRAKTDATMIHAAQMKESTPQSSHDRSEAQASRVRGRND
jgi:hypothetical protein